MRRASAEDITSSTTTTSTNNNNNNTSSPLSPIRLFKKPRSRTEHNTPNQQEMNNNSGLSSIPEGEEVSSLPPKRKTEERMPEIKKMPGFSRRASDEGISSGKNKGGNNASPSLGGRKKSDNGALQRIANGECMLKVRVVGGDGIKTAKGKDFSPYVNLILPGSVVAKTFTLKKTSSPFWDQFADLPVNPWIQKSPDEPKEFRPPRSLFVELWEETTFGAKKIKGKARISLTKIVQGVPTDCYVDIPPAKGKLYLQLTALGFGKKASGSRVKVPHDSSSSSSKRAHSEDKLSASTASAASNNTKESNNTSDDEHKKQTSSHRKSSAGGSSEAFKSRGSSASDADSDSEGSWTGSNSEGDFSGKMESLAKRSSQDSSESSRLTFTSENVLLHMIKDVKWTTDLRTAKEERENQHNKYGVP